MRPVLVKGRDKSYTLSMIRTALLLVLMCAAPQGKVFWGAVPREVPTYNVTLPDGQIWRAGIRKDGKWVPDIGELELGGAWLELVADLPWQDPQPTRKEHGYKLKDWARVTTALRRDRLEEGWGEAGYTFVETANGPWPVQKTELEYARRAKELAMTLEAAPEAAADPQQSAGGEGVENPEPAWVQQWAGHAVVLAVGLALLAVVLRTMVFGKSP